MLLFTVAAHAAVIIMTEDMIGVMMTGTITAGHTGKLYSSFTLHLQQHKTPKILKCKKWL